MPLVVDADPEHVARQQVARELDASQLAADRLGKSARERRLADAGDVFDEDVTAREERDQRELDRVGLALEGLLHSGAKLLQHGRSLARDGDRRRHQR